MGGYRIFGFQIAPLTKTNPRSPNCLWTFPERRSQTVRNAVSGGIAFVDPFGVIQVNCFGKSLDRRGRQWVRWSAQSEWRGRADADEACSKAGIEPFKATRFLELEQ